jgi:cholera toxin transcriptional activator
VAQGEQDCGGEHACGGDGSAEIEEQHSVSEEGGVGVAQERKVATGFLDRVLASPEDLPKSSHAVVQTLFVLLQVMYLGFYIGALANLAEINELMSALPHGEQIFVLMIVTAAVLIPVRTFLLCAALFYARGLREKFRRLWLLLLPLDMLWALSPFLLLHHINAGLALACMTFLVYSPFAQRSLILMGAGSR